MMRVFIPNNHHDAPFFSERYSGWQTAYIPNIVRKTGDRWRYRAAGAAPNWNARVGRVYSLTNEQANGLGFPHYLPVPVIPLGIAYIPSN